MHKRAVLNCIPIFERDGSAVPAIPVIVGAARSFGANPLLVTAHARAFIQGLHAEGVLTALKHFPGHGSSYGDSHKGFVDVTTTANPEAELAPYRTLITERLADAVMTAHVFTRALDSEFPATLSRATLTGLLRGELGFDGPVVTDDLRMGAIEQRWGLETAAVTALAAGAEIGRASCRERGEISVGAGSLKINKR